MVHLSVVTDPRPIGDVSRTQIQQKQATRDKGINYSNNNNMNKRERVSYILNKTRTHKSGRRLQKNILKRGEQHDMRNQQNET